MNTADKRASSLLVGLPFGRFFWTPDGAMDQADRQHAALSYRGILARTTGTPPPLLYLPRRIDASDVLRRRIDASDPLRRRVDERR